MVMPVNENRVLCQLQANRKTDCDEMATARQEIDDIYKLQNYVDAQAGGPGQGFFQIVTDPFEARRVINEGKMAVVLEVEISEPFGCRGLESTSTCSQAQIDSQLQDLYDRGVRSSLLLNKFDNPLTGVRFDSGEVGDADQRRQQGELGLVLERRDLSGSRARQRDLQRRADRALRHPAGDSRRSGRHRPRLSARAALQHPRPDLTRRPHRRADDGSRNDRQPRPHEPARGRRDHQARRAAPLLGRDLAPRLDGSPQLAPDLGARRDGVPQLGIGQRVRRGLAQAAARQHALTTSAGAGAPTSAASPPRARPSRPIRRRA